MEVVVVVDELLHDAAPAAECHARPDEHVLRSGRREAIHEILGEHAVDLPWRVRAALAPVSSRVVDVDVEPVLVRGVAEPAESPAESTAARPGEVPHADSCGFRMRGAILAQDAQERAHEAIGPPAAP